MEKTEVIRVRMSHAEKLWVEMKAKEMNCSISECIRLCLFQPNPTDLKMRQNVARGLCQLAEFIKVIGNPNVREQAVKEMDAIWQSIR